MLTMLFVSVYALERPDAPQA